MASSTSPTPAPVLTSVEERLVDCCRSGTDLDLSGVQAPIRAAVIYDLCTGRHPGGPPHGRGVRLKHATISGPLDFSGAQLLAPLYLTECAFSEPVTFRDACARTVSLEGSTLPAFEGERAEVSGALAFKNCRGLNSVRLSDASIGVLNFEGAHISAADAFALRADRISVRGSVFLRKGFECKGGVSLEDARIGGRLDCSGATIERIGTAHAFAATGVDVKGMLDFQHARVKGKIHLTAAQVGGSAVFDGCTSESDEAVLSAQGAQFKSAVLFRDGCHFKGTVTLAFASISATLELAGGAFSAPGRTCLDLRELKTAGSVFLSCTFDGMVNIAGIQSGGDISVGPAIFLNPGNTALVADGAVIRSFMQFKDVQVQGDVRLYVARIANSLEIAQRTSIQGDILAGEMAVEGHVALHPDLRVSGRCSVTGARIGGSLSVSGEIQGQFSLKSAEITGSVGFRQARINGGIQAEGANCKSGVDLADSLICTGEVDFAGAQISNHFAAQRAKLTNDGGVALNLDNAVVKGNADCEGLDVNGVVRLRNAEISGDLRFSGATIRGASGKAIRAAGCVVKSGLFLDENFTAMGGIRLSRARITGVLNMYKANITQTSDHEPALRFQSMEVQGRFEFRHCRISGDIALTGSSIGLMVDDFESWPAGRYRIDNFSYRALRFAMETMPVEKRLHWLQNQQGFSLESYQHAADVLRGAGYDRQARAISRARRDDLRSKGNLSCFRKFSNWMLSISIGHGYQLWRPLIPAVLLIVVGTFVFAAAKRTGALIDKDTTHPIPFVSLMYSLDSLAPIVNFRQKDNFIFASGAPRLIWYEAYFWFHTFMGWVLSTLLVAGFTGITKRD